MKRTIAVAAGVCLVVLGWMGGYEHKRIKVQLAERAAQAQRVLIPMPSLGEELAEIKSLALSIEPQLKNETDPLAIALILRNAMYHRIPFSSRETIRPQKPYDFTKLAETYLKSVLDARYGLSCGGRAIQYLTALRSFGLTARYVGLYTEVHDAPTPVSSHASVDVLIAGKWVAMDPHFNVSLRDDAGRRLSWPEIAQRLKSEDSVFLDSDGFTTRPGIDFNEYVRRTGTNLSDLTNYVVIGPYWDGTETLPARAMPDGWDGVIRYADKSTFAALESAMSAPYTTVAGPLVPSTLPGL